MLESARFVTLHDGRRLRVFDAGPYRAPVGRVAPVTRIQDAEGSPDADGTSDALASSGAPVAKRAPLVVLEGGLAASGRSWGSVFHRLAPNVRVIAYDRAGYGASDPADLHARRLTDLRDDLLAVIADAERDDTGPIILVGHSWGAVIVRAVAATRLAAGQRVDGVVLVDPSDERADVYFTPAARYADRLQGRIMVPLARVGLLRPIVEGSLSRLPRQLRQQTAADTGTIEAARAISAETAAFIDDLAGLRTSPLDLGDVPVRILSGVRADYGVKPIRETLRAAHRASASAFTNGVFIDAPASAHGVPFTDAQLIADTVLALARS